MRGVSGKMKPYRRIQEAVELFRFFLAIALVSDLLHHADGHTKCTDDCPWPWGKKNTRMDGLLGNVDERSLRNRMRAPSRAQPEEHQVQRAIHLPNL